MLIGCISEDENFIKMDKLLNSDNNNYLKHYNALNIRTLNEFVAHNRNLINLEALAIFIDDVDTTNIIEALQSLKMICDARLIIIALDNSTNKELIAKISEKCKINNTIILSETTDFKSELELCLSEEGKTLKNTLSLKKNSKIEALRNATNFKLNIPDGFCLEIGVVGTENRVGTTTQAMLILAYLKSIGFNTAYIDRNDSKTINSMSVVYDYEEKNNSKIINGIILATDKSDDTTINAYVSDYGVIDLNNISEWDANDISILCSGSKPWELQKFAHAITKFNLLPTTHILFSFAGESDKKPISELLAETSYKYSYCPYTPDLFKLDNIQFYDTMLKADIIEAIEKWESQKQL